MRRARKESGFALLLVFLMAAMIAISLYMEIPRVAMESQRQKEQLLIARGEQYKRAVLVFFKNNNRWPARIEELENLNNRRYLRRRYIDPMTGKDEWRIIHVQNGVFTDSLVNKPKTGQGTQAAADSTAGQYVAVNNGMFDTGGASGSTGPNTGRRRISDGGAGGGTVVSMEPGTGGSTGANGNATAPPADGSTPETPPVGTPGRTNPNAGQSPQLPPGLSGVPGMSGMPGMPPGVPGVPGSPVDSQTGGVSATPYPTTPGANGAMPGFGQPGMGMPGATGQNPNAAASLIGQILTSPRPGGPPGANLAAGAAGMVMGGGIAGVASKMDAEGIMVYNDRTNYKEWEFIFDPSKWRPPPNPLSAPPTTGTGAGTPASQLGNLQQTQIGTSVNDIVAQQQGTAGSSGASGSTGTTGTAPVKQQ